MLNKRLCHSGSYHTLVETVGVAPGPDVGTRWSGVQRICTENIHDVYLLWVKMGALTLHTRLSSLPSLKVDGLHTLQVHWSWLATVVAALITGESIGSSLSSCTSLTWVMDDNQPLPEFLKSNWFVTEPRKAPIYVSDENVWIFVQKPQMILTKNVWMSIVSM
jgi:hypothetical protein